MLTCLLGEGQQILVEMTGSHQGIAGNTTQVALEEQTVPLASEPLLTKGPDSSPNPFPGPFILSLWALTHTAHTTSCPSDSQR